MATKANEQESLKGLQNLSDEVLAQIVEEEIAEGGVSEAGRIALRELSRRSPE